MPSLEKLENTTQFSVGLNFPRRTLVTKGCFAHLNKVLSAVVMSLLIPSLLCFLGFASVGFFSSCGSHFLFCHMSRKFCLDYGHCYYIKYYSILC